MVKDMKKAMEGACFQSSRVSLCFLLLFFFPCHFVDLFLSLAFPTSLCRCSALQGAGFMSWWGLGVFAGKSDSKVFYIAYTAIHHYSAFPARRTPRDFSSALTIL